MVVHQNRKDLASLCGLCHVVEHFYWPVCKHWLQEWHICGIFGCKFLILCRLLVTKALNQQLADL